MSLALVASGASFEFRWRRWAVLRDCVAEHLEGGKVGSRFPHLHSIGDALVRGRVLLPAAELRRELEAIGEELRGRTVDDLVLGPSTARVLYLGEVRLEGARPLSERERSDIAPASPDTDLADYFVSFLESAIRVCDHVPAEKGEVEVLDL